jgi:uncharacterized protein (TIGR00266 family)
MTFKVNVTGFSADDRAATVAGFAATFKLSPEKAQALLSSLPRSIKSGLDAETAERYRSALDKIGLKAEVAAETRDTAAEAATPAPAMKEAPQPGLPFTIEARPDFAFLTVKVPAGETIKVEASAMATMDTHMKMRTKLSGGLGRLLTSESIFINEFTAENAAGEIGIAPAAPGDLAHVHLNDGDVLFLQNGAFVACAPGVKLESKWQGLVKGFFSGESFFLIRASGQGDLWFNSYGGMIEKDVDGEYVVDTGNIVAFSEGLDYRVEKFGGYKSFFFSGEGLICRFRGKGRVWIQTRTTGALLSWIEQFRLSKKGA